MVINGLNNFNQGIYNPYAEQANEDKFYSLGHGFMLSQK